MKAILCLLFLAGMIAADEQLIPVANDDSLKVFRAREKATIANNEFSKVLADVRAKYKCENCAFTDDLSALRKLPEKTVEAPAKTEEKKKQGRP